MKKYVKDFLDRALEKYTEHQQRKVARETQKPTRDHRAPRGTAKLDDVAGDSFDSLQSKADDGEDIVLSDNEALESSGSPDRKRKREAEVVDSPSLTPSDGPLTKRPREDELDDTSPPPPPPPPPESDMEDVMGAEQQALREQEEALMRENEEAQRLEDEANRSKGMDNAFAERSNSS